MLRQYTALSLVALKSRKMLLLQLTLVEILGKTSKNCPAREAFRNKCEKNDHFAKVCQSERGAVSAAMHQTNDNAS